MFKKSAAVALISSPLAAFAAVPENVTTALTGGLTDATAVAALGLVIVVGIAVFKYMRRGV
jgi:uncharacterized membrane protein